MGVGDHYLLPLPLQPVVDGPEPGPLSSRLGLDPVGVLSSSDYISTRVSRSELLGARLLSYSTIHRSQSWLMSSSDETSLECLPWRLLGLGNGLLGSKVGGKRGELVACAA